MAKKKHKRTGEPSAPPMTGGLMDELLGQLLSAPAAPVESPVSDVLEAGEIEAGLPAPTEDTLVALSAAMDDAGPIAMESASSEEIKPESLLAMVEVAGTEASAPEPVCPVEPNPVEAAREPAPQAQAEPPVENPVSAEPVAVAEAEPPAVMAGPVIEPQPPAAPELAVETAAAEVARNVPAFEELARTTEPGGFATPRVPSSTGGPAGPVRAPEHPLQPAGLEPPLAAESTAAEEAPEVATPFTSPETASRILRSRQQQTGLGEGGLLDTLIGAIDNEIARSPLAGGADRADTGETGAVETCAVFSLGGAAYGVPVQNILEIDQAGEVTPVPNVPEFVRGVVNLRGEVMCVLDLSAFIGQPALPEDHTGWLMVVQGGRKQQTAALLVDQIGNLVRVPESQLRRPAGTVNDKVSSLLRGTLERNDKILRVLSLDSLFESGELQQLRM